MFSRLRRLEGQDIPLIGVDILLSFILLESEAEDEVGRRNDLFDLFPLLFPVGPVEEELFCRSGNGPFVWKDLRFKDDLSRLPFHNRKKGIFSYGTRGLRMGDIPQFQIDLSLLRYRSK
jgi:hypothetical protein